MNTSIPAREAVARAVRGLLAEHRLTQVEVAKSAGMARTTLARKLAGRAPFNLDELDAIAVVLGITKAEIISSAERIREQVAS